MDGRTDGGVDGGADGWRRGRLAGCLLCVGVCLMVILFCTVNSTRVAGLIEVAPTFRFGGDALKENATAIRRLVSYCQC